MFKIIMLVLTAINLFCGFKVWLMALACHKTEDGPSYAFVWKMRIFAIVWLISCIAMCTLNIIHT